MDGAKIVTLAELILGKAGESYNADRPLQYSEMALITRSCYEIERETTGAEAAGRAEPPHAHWMRFDSGGEYSDRWQCSRCRRTARTESWGKKCEYERCPHCGAIMDGGERR